MAFFKVSRYLVVSGLIIILALIPAIGVGCAAPKVSDSLAPASSGILSTELANTLVPNLNLDVYLYFHQESPTMVPKDLIGSANDVSVDSLAIWGIVDQTTYSVSGALNFTSAADANIIYGQLPQLKDVWTQLSMGTIYFVLGSGGPAASFKSAISNNDFKHYNDGSALGEVLSMPYGNTTNPAGIGFIKPTSAVVNLLKQYLDANTMSTIDSIQTWAKPQLLVIGIYSSQPIGVTEISQKISNNTIWDVDLGVVVSCSSSIPGLIFSPIASKYLDNAGYLKASVGTLAVYKSSVDGGNGKIVPVLINVAGNHVFVTASGKESYADTLMTSIAR